MDGAGGVSEVVSIPVARPASAATVTDRGGATASLLCAVHCALLPFVLASLPLIGLGFLADHRFERGFILFACTLALASIGVGFRRHRHFRAFWFVVPGLVLLLVGGFVDFGSAIYTHAVLVSIGGTLVALAHVTNLRLSHGHVHDAACGH